jgi:hypothetical protein
LEKRLIADDGSRQIMVEKDEVAIQGVKVGIDVCKAGLSVSSVSLTKPIILKDSVYKGQKISVYALYDRIGGCD